MSLTEIQTLIHSLDDADRSALLHWLRELDWQAWDRQFEEDVEAGRLDHLADEALETDPEELEDLFEGLKRRAEEAVQESAPTKAPFSAT
jgi:hypothetical protein